MIEADGYGFCLSRSPSKPVLEVGPRNPAKGSARVLLWRQGPSCRSVDIGRLRVGFMSVSIQSCPSCRTLLLDDTIQCPLCQHVVKSDVAEQFSGELPDAVAVEDRSDGVECADCGEVVRPELVRCWRCGAFLRADIAARYQEMQRNPSQVMYSESSGAGEPEDTALATAQQSSTSTAGAMAMVEDGDFELADGVNMSDGADFELDDELLKHAEPVTKPVSDSPSGGSSDTESSDESAGESGDVADESQASAPTSHPLSSSGEALLDIAMSEEAETRTRRRQGSASVTRGGARATAKSGFIVFCPNGHPIEVHERHRGKSGKCPKCQSPFLVPQQNWDPVQAGVEAVVVSEESPDQRFFVNWLDDVHLHQVDPGGLKLKVGSLAAKFDVIDLGFSAEKLLLVKLVKGGGMFGGGAVKKIPEVREQVRVHLEDVRSTDGLPAAEFISLAAEACEALRIVQPAPYAHESMFAGIEVFGEGRIGVRLPQDPDSKTIDFLSFSLSEFRRVSSRLEQLYGIVAFGADVGIPLQDSPKEVTCHYNDETTMTIVADATYYEVDDAYVVTRVGCRCGSCGLAVSEDARKKEKIGGKAGKGLAKAVCPKCKRIFGDNPLCSIALVDVDDAVEDAAESGETSGTDAPSADTSDVPASVEQPESSVDESAAGGRVGEADESSEGGE
jgi:hypothetical protein